MNVLKPIIVKAKGPEDGACGDGLYSAYFSSGYSADKKKDLIDTLSKYDGSIRRFHLPPELNLRHLDETIGFMRHLYDDLKSSSFGISGRVGIDAHPGHGIGMVEIKSKAKMLNDYLVRHSDPQMYVSIENIKKSGLSTRDQITDFARYVRDNRLDNIRVTVDIADLESASGGAGSSPFYKLVRDMRSEGTLGVLDCVHAPKNSADSISDDLKELADSVYLVTEGHPARQVSRGGHVQHKRAA